MPISLTGTMTNSLGQAAMAPELLPYLLAGRLNNEQEARDQAALAGQATLAAIAAERQRDAAQATYQQAAAQPLELPQLGLAGGLGLIGAHLATAFSGQPEYVQGARQQLAAARADALSRRSDVLQTLRDQLMEASYQARQAGETQRALEFTTKAAAITKQHEEVSQQIQESLRFNRGVAEQKRQERLALDKEARDRQFDFWRVRYEASAAETRARIGAADQTNQAVKARLDALGKAYEAQVKPLQEILSLPGTTKQALQRQADAMAQLAKYTEDYQRQVEGVVNVGPAPPTGPPGLGSPGGTPPPSAGPGALKSKISAIIQGGVTDSDAFRRYLSQTASSGVSYGELLQKSLGVNAQQLFDEFNAQRPKPRPAREAASFGPQAFPQNQQERTRTATALRGGVRYQPPVSRFVPMNVPAGPVLMNLGGNAAPDTLDIYRLLNPTLIGR